MISAALSVTADLIALFAVLSAVQMTPAGSWDDDVLAAIQVSAFTGGLFAVLAALFLIVPVTRHWLHWWWFLPPAVLLVAAISRFSWVSIVYPAS